MTELITATAELSRTLMTRLEQELPNQVWVLQETQLLEAFGLTAAQAVHAFKTDAAFTYSTVAVQSSELGEALLISNDYSLLEVFLHGQISGTILKIVSVTAEGQPVLHNTSRTAH